MKKVFLRVATVALCVAVCLGCLCLFGCDKGKTFEVDGVTFKYGEGQKDADGRKWSYVIIEDAGGKSEITVPAEYEGKPIEMFHGFKQEDKSGIVKVTLSEGIKYVFGGAFKDCVDLEEVVLPDSLEYIANNAFIYCFALKTLKIPAGVQPTSFQDYSMDIFGQDKSDAGSYCPRLSEIWVENDAMKKAFFSAGNTAVNLIEKGGVSGLIVDGDFVYCLEIYYAGLSEKPVLYLVEYTGNSEIVTVEVPDGFELKIKEGAFLGNEKVQKITLEEGVIEIGYGAFAGCTSLEILEIPESVEKMWEVNLFNTSIFGEKEFSACTSLSRIVYAGNQNKWQRYNVSVGGDCYVEFLK